MAEGKKSFVAYADWKEMFEALPNEVAGALIKHIFSYVNDENPVTDDYVINALFVQVKSTLKRDLTKWEIKKEQRSEAGKASAEARRLRNETVSTKSNERSIPLDESVRKPTVNCNMLDVTTKVVVLEEYNKILDGSFSEDPKYRIELGKNIENLKSYDSWKGDIAKQQNILPISDVDLWIDKYKEHILTQPKTDISVNELRKHFSNWFKLRLKAGDKISRPMTPQGRRDAISKSFNTN